MTIIIIIISNIYLIQDIQHIYKQLADLYTQV